MDELKNTLSALIETCKTVYEDYKDKRDQVIQLRKKHHQTFDYNAAWSTGPEEDVAPPESEVVYYRALYDFESRNPDELSFTAGEIITKDTSSNPDPGWLAGIIDDRSGWFPEAFIEIYDPNTAGFDAADAGFTTEAGFAAEEPVAVPGAEVAADEYAGEYYVAIYPYDSAEAGDLSFQVGETILVTHAEGEWWTGSIGADRTGVFPGNFVAKPEEAAGEAVAVPADSGYTEEASTMAEEPSKTQLEPYEEAELKREMSEIIQQNQAAVPKSPKAVKSGKRYEIGTVLATYQPSGAGQLALTRGMLVTVRKKSPSGWWEGELQAKGKKREIGWFPGSYVKILGPGGASSRGGSSRTTPIPFDDMPDETAPVFFGSEAGDGDGRSSAAGMAGEQVIALYPYTAQNTDELTFVKDDVITIISKDEPDWWRGQLGSTVGLFPTNYVEPLGSKSALQ